MEVRFWRIARLRAVDRQPFHNPVTEGLPTNRLGGSDVPWLGRGVSPISSHGELKDITLIVIDVV